MNVSHKVLDTGYHHVRAVGYAHLFAQWPVGTPLSLLEVSHGQYHPGDDVLREFIESAQRAAVSAGAKPDV